MKQFALLGTAGYVAPKHLQAIHDTKNILVAACDISDSVGILDRYFPKCQFFVEENRFERYLGKLLRQNNNVEYLSICTPNYLHDAHIKMALRNEADAICEKPMVLNPWNLESLYYWEQKTGKTVWNILQLRKHAAILALKEEVDTRATEVYDVDITYITGRGNWYYSSWKGDEAKSGGLATNIGVHLFDMLIFLFGKPKHIEMHQRTHDRTSGYLEFDRAKVRWFLSINTDCIPPHHSEKRTYRSVQFNDKEIEFSTGFQDLHTLLYQDILTGDGYRIQEVEPSVDLIHKLRNIPLRKGEAETKHALSALPESKHPYSRQ